MFIVDIEEYVSAHPFSAAPLVGDWGPAGPDDAYVCAEHGCACGWEYTYELGEPRTLAGPQLP